MARHPPSRDELLRQALRRSTQPERGDYWGQAADFLQDIGTTPRTNLSERQQDWLSRIEDDLSKAVAEGRRGRPGPGREEKAPRSEKRDRRQRKRKARPEAGVGKGVRGVALYTDGACINNPGRGGYGVVVLEGSSRRELSEGYRHTTNNRMELLSAIRGLQAVEEWDSVTVFSDSTYVVNGIKKGWARRWKQNGWRKGKKGEKAKNPDLWEELLTQCDRHKGVGFTWVKGHAGNPENERADQLAMQAAQGLSLSSDEGYEGG